MSTYPYPDADPQLVTSLKSAVDFLTKPSNESRDYLRGATRSQTEPAWLTRYVERGFQLVFWPRLPDPRNDWKGPRDDGWQTKTYLPCAYRDGMQVGVKLGTEVAPHRHLLDVDLDWEPGIWFA